MRKGLRFDIFRRDNFTCRYCGAQPPDVVLEVDHVVPRAAGGDDDPLNLVTACWNCNHGKAAKSLELSASVQPDADLEYLAVQQEVAEIRRYMAAKEVRDQAIEELLGVLARHWMRNLTPLDCPEDHQFKRWLQRYTPEQIEEAIDRASPSYHNERIRSGMYGLILYVAGILKNIVEEA